MKRFDVRNNIQEMIQYEDKDVLVFCKPAGLPVQSARMGQMDLESLLKNYLAEVVPGQMPYVGIVHRLDQPVEGLLVFGKNKKSTVSLNQQLGKGEVEKKYLAVVHGNPEPKEGKLVDYLKRDGKTNTSSVVSEHIRDAKRSVLNYRTLEILEDMALVEINLETGRHHQIRVQMAHGNTPLVGDHKYGRADGVKNVALCAYKLSYCHPDSGKKMKFEILPKGEIFRKFSSCQE